ncbi:2-amino-4-hydroxy-6-hydroxymethyldihydropteridine diphosphokinase [Geminicoccaceae bacterium 1502E]|nr:2-amino-4-hydroxy-6-hydroxymethyldihydropteridine diphosphokinase [Geminicoccaceae bacterium 1502E]
MSERAVIALGANLEDPRATFERALELLEERAGPIVARSSWRQSEAMVHPDDEVRWHPPYLNGAALVATALEPEALLAVLHAIEAELGRDRSREKGRWQPRTLDLDLVAYGQQRLDRPALTVPHPRMQERDFVLLPLVELWPDWRHPVLGRTARELLADLCGSGPAG